jgi:hypothetical protein
MEFFTDGSMERQMVGVFCPIISIWCQPTNASDWIWKTGMNVKTSSNGF